MRCPASVATVITCQRRREEAERPVAEARERLATPCDRAPADESAHAIPRARGGVADPAGALLAREDEREADDRDREDRRPDQRSRRNAGCRSLAAVSSASATTGNTRFAN